MWILCLATATKAFAVAYFSLFRIGRFGIFFVDWERSRGLFAVFFYSGINTAYPMSLYGKLFPELEIYALLVELFRYHLYLRFIYGLKNNKRKTV